MKIEKLTEIIMSTNPCLSGLCWYKDLSEGCKTSTEFFNKCKKQNYSKDGCAYSPHGYLRYIFYKCINWSEFGNEEFLYCQYNASRFLYENFKVYNYFMIPIPDLCDALKRAFK